MGAVVDAFRGIRARLRARDWRERTLFWTLVAVLTPTIGWLAWQEGVGFWVTRHGDVASIGMNPIFWWLEVFRVAPSGEGSLFIYGAYWFVLALIAAKLAVLPIRVFRQKREVAGTV